MAEKILVALKRDGQIDEIVSYVQEVWKPAMRVIFLFPYPIDSWSYFRDHWIEADSARGALLAAKEIMERDSWEAQRKRAAQMLAPALRALQNKGVEVEVDLYAGSVRRVVQDYMTDKDIHWIVMAPLGGGWFGYFLAKAVAACGWSSCLPSGRVFNPGFRQSETEARAHWGIGAHRGT